MTKFNLPDIEDTDLEDPGWDVASCTDRQPGDPA
jgi:hypothetical protein